MRNSNLNAALKTAHAANLSVFIKGAPGTGKTAGVRQYAESIGQRLISIHAPLTDLLDVKGVISTEGDKARFLPLAIWPKEDDAPVVVLIDELPQCVPAIQNAYSQLLIDKQMGDIKLPKGSLVIATGNRREDKAACHNIPSHIVNRVMHIDLEPEVEDFFVWALGNQISPEIIAFGRFRPSCIYAFDPKNTQEPYPTFRSWEFVSNILKAKPAPNLLFDLIGGTVGKGAAGEFLAFLKIYQNLPDPKEILKNPSTLKVPDDQAVIYALITALGSLASKETADALFEIAEHFDTEWGVLLIKTAKAVCPEIFKSKGIAKWASANAKYILE